MKTPTYKEILETPFIKEHYDKIDKSYSDGAYHGTTHINNTIDNALNLFKIVNFDKHTKNAILIALALHDIGKSYPDGKKIDDHGLLGYNFAKDFLKEYDIKYKTEILNAIKLHDASCPEHDLIGAAVCMCDKLDVTKKRAIDQNKREGTSNQTAYLVRFFTKCKLQIKNKTFIVTYHLEKTARIDKAMQSRYFLRSLEACRNFARKIGLNFIYRYKLNMDFAVIEAFAQNEMTHSGHDFSHAKRVFNLCKKILNYVPASPKIVLTSALLHDCVDYKFYKNTDKQYEKIKNLLTAENFSEEEYNQIKWICENTSFSKHADLTGNYDAQTVADADRLEATGAIGIIRSIQFSTTRGVNFTAGEDEINFFAANYKEHKNNYPDWAKQNIKTCADTKETPLFHINEKVMKIADNVYSDWAKQEAKKRIKFVLKFLREYYREV
jgi:uncharacterized protein